jgi:glycerol kinase
MVFFMPSGEYVLALDEGTTSARALIFNRSAEVKGIGQSKILLRFGKPN